MPIVVKTTGFDEFLDPAKGSHIKALLMGEHGVGKTPSAACWPQPIIADCENGLMSVANKSVPYVSVTSSQDMTDLLDMLRREGQKASENRKYRTLVIDTIDSYQRRLIQERLRAERKDSLSGWADWGWLDGKMSQLIERLLNLPMHVVVNMHVKDFEDKSEDGESSVLVKKARLKGDIKDAIFQDFDLIGQMEASYVAGTGEKKGERVRSRQIRWHSEPRFPMLRDRSNKLPRFTDVDFTDQDFFRIFNAITEGVDDLPATTVLETIEGDAPVVVPGPDEKGGPVESPALPRDAKKATAKKAPAKKTAAKKAAPAAVTEAIKESEEMHAKEVAEDAKAEDPWKPPTEAEEKSTEAIAADEAVALVKDKLGGEVVAEDFISEEPTAEDPPKPEPTKTPAATSTAKHCGDQPESMASRGFEPAPGCGRVLTADNAGRSQIAVLKAKTYLCDDCFDTFTAN